mmetsp:Transcript_67575/g.187395  ORF Transcript_67575/g.187395 Transcript_67575/m.187395 type:complete len:248 (-) Transcript_67575:82-825(-)
MEAVLASLRRSFLCDTPPPLLPLLHDWNLTSEEAPPDCDEECSICLAPLRGQLARTHCGHLFHMACLEESFQVSGRATCPLCRSSLRGPHSVTARATSGRPIEVLDHIPGIGGKCHLDRDYKFVCLGDFGKGERRMFYIQTSNEDKRTPASAVMWELKCLEPVTVYLNFRSEKHVTRTGAQVWLREGGWQRSGMKSTVSTGVPDFLYWGPVYSKAFNPGTIELMGSNCALGTYLVFIETESADQVGC